VEDKEMISVSREYLQGLLNKVQNLEDHVRALEAINRELGQAANELD
jgi:hypothetical protein